MLIMGGNVFSRCFLNEEKIMSKIQTLIETAKGLTALFRDVALMPARIPAAAYKSVEKEHNPLVALAAGIGAGAFTVAGLSVMVPLVAFGAPVVGLAVGLPFLLFGGSNVVASGAAMDWDEYSAAPERRRQALWPNITKWNGDYQEAKKERYIAEAEAEKEARRLAVEQKEKPQTAAGKDNVPELTPS
jgi:hypothetical protein